MKGILTSYYGTEYGLIGEYAFNYHGINYYVGDVIKVIKSTCVHPYTFVSIVVKNKDGYPFIFGYPHKDLHEYKIEKIKSFTELKNGETYAGITVRINDLVLTDDEVKRLLSKEDKQALIEIELELALRVKDSKTFNKLAKEYSKKTENSIDNIYDQYKKNYEKIKDSKITNDEILSYLELIINNYLDIYSSNAKNYKEFLRTVRMYNQLRIETISNE